MRFFSTVLNDLLSAVIVAGLLSDTTSRHLMSQNFKSFEEAENAARRFQTTQEEATKREQVRRSTRFSKEKEKRSYMGAVQKDESGGKKRSENGTEVSDHSESHEEEKGRGRWRWKPNKRYGSWGHKSGEYQYKNSRCNVCSKKKHMKRV